MNAKTKTIPNLDALDFTKEEKILVTVYIRAFGHETVEDYLLEQANTFRKEFPEDAEELLEELKQ